jgi:hypothetical protein
MHFQSRAYTGTVAKKYFPFILLGIELEQVLSHDHFGSQATCDIYSKFAVLLKFCILIALDF